MIGYVCLGTNQLEAATAFYDALLADLGAQRFTANERMTVWGTAPGAPMLGVFIPFDGQPATPGNGVMVALAAGSRERVDALHKRALELGASDDGAPGERMAGFYGGYFRDLDGNKLNFFHMG